MSLKYVLLRKYNDQSIFLEVDNNNKYSSKFLVLKDLDNVHLKIERIKILYPD